ncbi:MAG: DUF6483 family protein [Oscillospiraceae bacterium]
MEFEQDWFMRQIHQLANFIAHIVLQKELTNYTIIDESNLTQSDLLYSKIKNLLNERKICEAEDLMFDTLDTSDNRYLELALDFYQSISLLSEEELKSCNFSREEIQSGLNEILNRFNIPDFEF